MGSSIVIVTSFGPTGYTEYGARFLYDYFRHWPWRKLTLHVWVEGEKLREKLQHQFRPARVHDLLQDPACARFLARYAEDPVAQGRRPKPGMVWKAKALLAGYNFRFDAYKFCRKVFALQATAALHAADPVRMFWVDADVVTWRAVPLNLFPTVLPDDVDICYLDRGPDYHSECGFVGYQLKEARVRQFLHDLAALYSTGKVFELAEWHDSWVFDWLRRARPELRCHALEHGNNRHAPFDHSILGQFMRHLKGDRKRRTPWQVAAFPRGVHHALH